MDQLKKKSLKSASDYRRVFRRCKSLYVKEKRFNKLRLFVQYKKWRRIHRRIRIWKFKESAPFLADNSSRQKLLKTFRICHKKNYRFNKNMFTYQIRDIVKQQPKTYREKLPKEYFYYYYLKTLFLEIFRRLALRIKTHKKSKDLYEKGRRAIYNMMKNRAIRFSIRRNIKNAFSRIIKPFRKNAKLYKRYMKYYKSLATIIFGLEKCKILKRKQNVYKVKNIRFNIKDIPPEVLLSISFKPKQLLSLMKLFQINNYKKFA